jgi:hypothetical protein
VQIAVVAAHGAQCRGRAVLDDASGVDHNHPIAEKLRRR